MKVLITTMHYLDGNSGGAYASCAFINAIAAVADSTYLMYPSKQGEKLTKINPCVTKFPVRYEKSKALKLLFNKNTNDKFNENKYQYIINRLKYEIEYYKNKNKVKSNQIISNSPKSFRKKIFNKNLFLNSNKYNTIKTYDNKSNIDIDTNRKIKSNQTEK